MPEHKVRVFLDANVLFSAAYQEDSGLRVFFALAHAGIIQLTASAFVLEEARRNIAVKRPDRAAMLETLIAELSLTAAPSSNHIAIAQAAGLPPKDVPILAAALAAETDLLVTGDRTHFGRLFGRSIGRLTVQRPREALATIISKARSKRARRFNE